MSDESTEKSAKPFDPFELLTAILLGLTAVGASVASLQSGQWGGKQLDAFAEANTLTTKASTQYNEDTVLMNADYAAVAVAKQHILEARDARDPVDRERHFDLASYFYESQLSEQAYKTMKLPAGYWEEDEDEKKADAAHAAEAGGAHAEAAHAEEPAAEAEAQPAAANALERDIPDAALIASLKEELDEAYTDKMLATGKEMFEKADARFAEGRVANEHGDAFELVGVIYTVGLVFAGLGLVFKTNMRWAMFGLGVLIFVISTGRMLMLPWAS